VIDLSRMLSTSQAARAVGASEQLIRHLVRTGRLARLETANGSLFEPEEIERLRRDRAARAAGSQTPAVVR